MVFAMNLSDSLPGGGMWIRDGAALQASATAECGGERAWIGSAWPAAKGDLVAD